MEQAINALYDRDTIVAVSTPAGVGGIAVIRLSGPQAKDVFGMCWKGVGLDKIVTHTAHLGKIINRDGDEADEVVATWFKGPRSFTGEDVVEISCHGSRWIQKEIVRILIENGARPAEPGEFTKRAFLNGRLDLAQAEGVADLIASSSRAAHRLAMQQTSGHFTERLDELRLKMIDLASLLELELDFSEEEVEFADRQKLAVLNDEILKILRRLAKSYSTGKVLKEGIPVVIAGAPNAGKSTLLNALLEEDKAIVSDIPGTTRDVIEDIAEIDGVLFRFADTAGLRKTADDVERIGIERAEARLHKARIVLWLADLTDKELPKRIEDIRQRIQDLPEAKHLILLNKIDELKSHDDNAGLPAQLQSELSAMYKGNGKDKAQLCVKKGNREVEGSDVLYISASEGEGIEDLKLWMVKESYGDYDAENDLMLTNERHYAAIRHGIESLERVSEALLAGVSADFIAQDIRESIHHLSLLTGKITTPDLLTTIFSRFCIGK